MNANKQPVHNGLIRKRILFFAEAVTLAHVARPMALATGLNADQYECIFACSPRYHNFLQRLACTIHPLNSIESKRFLEALARGTPVYDTRTLRAYVEEDLALIQALKPDLVVGDFRLSLSVSARLSKVPYFNISSAYWSPYARSRFIVPELPLTKWLGVSVAQALFTISRPLAFAYHSLPLNRIRREFGLPSLGFSLQRVYTDADMTLYADVPELIPLHNLPPNHRYLGPVLWSPEVAKPFWWDKLSTGDKVIYVTLGSSGPHNLLGSVLEALNDFPYTVVAATAGHPLPAVIPTNVYIADYLPGEEVAARAALVVCNGGSPTSQQALAAGTPVLGISSNLDQFLNMQAVERIGAGITLRAGRATISTIRAAAHRVLGTESFGQAASSLARVFSCYHAPKLFAACVDEVLADVSGNIQRPVTTGLQLGSASAPVN